MIALSNPKAEIYFPQGSGDDLHLEQTTHLGVGAHPDDLEIFAIHGILEAYADQNKHFTGVTVTDGRGAPRSGDYAGTSDETLVKIRSSEQKKSADLGQYNTQFLLNYTSSSIKSPINPDLVADLKNILTATSPSIIYTHNLADKHDTHVAVALTLIQALRDLEPAPRTIKLYGCEVWRGLDWLPDEKKVVLDVSEHITLQENLLSIFESQISGGKRYDLATLGRRLTNATYFQSHHTDTASHAVYAMDLTPLINHPEMDIEAYISKDINDFAADVRERLKRLRKGSV